MALPPDARADAKPIDLWSNSLRSNDDDAAAPPIAADLASSPDAAVVMTAQHAEQVLEELPAAPVVVDPPAPPAQQQAEADIPLFQTASLAEPGPVADLIEPPAIRVTPAVPSSGPETVRSFAGRWAGHISGCSPRNKKSSYIPLTLNERGAKAGDAACTFGKLVRNGNRWAVDAQCRNSSERWGAHVKLVLAGEKLTWTSERGTQNYVRCR